MKHVNLHVWLNEIFIILIAHRFFNKMPRKKKVTPQNFEYCTRTTRSGRKTKTNTMIWSQQQQVYLVNLKLHI